MVKVGLLVRLEAKKGMEGALEDFLRGALPLAIEELKTTAWFAIRMNESTFGIFDVFNDEAGRTAHLDGKIAASLFQSAATLLAKPPEIEKIEVLAAKL